MGGEEGTLKGWGRSWRCCRRKHSWYCHNGGCPNNFMGTIHGKQGFVWPGTWGGCFLNPWLTSIRKQPLALRWSCSHQSRTCSVLCREDFLTAGIPQTSITKMGQDPPDCSTPEPAPWFLTAPSAKLLFAENHYCPSLLNLPQMMLNWGTN